MSNSGYDKVLDDRIGYGKYQRVASFFLGLIALSDETEIISLAIIIPTLRDEWSLTETQEEMIGSVLFASILLGSIVSGSISERLGRRLSLLISSLISFFTIPFSASAPSYNVFIVARFISGFSVGCCISIAPVLLGEILPKSHRGKGQVIMQGFAAVGMLYALGLAKLFLGDFGHENWRPMIYCSMIPNAIVLLGVMFYLLESPKYLITKGQINKGISLLKTMGIRNTGTQFFTLSPEDEEEINNWYRKITSYKEKKSIFYFFKKRHWKVTLSLIVNWAGMAHNFFGMIYILPFLFTWLSALIDFTRAPIDLFIICMIGEIPALLISYCLIDQKSVERKKSMISYHIISALILFLAFILKENFLLALLFISRLFTKMAYITLSPLTTELYPAAYRVLALGVIGGIGKIGAVVMPFDIMKLYDKSPYAPLLGFAVISLVMALASGGISYGPLRMQLDNTPQKKENDKIKLREADVNQNNFNMN